MSIAATTTETRRRIDPLVLVMATLVVTDLVGGLIAVSSEVNTWGEAWGSKALLAAPLPMIGAQIVLTVLAVRLSGGKAAIPAGLLALACLVSVVSGFFDGGLGNDELTTGLAAYQTLVLVVTGAVGALAAQKAWRSRAQ